jgi:hypothetical protein
MQTRYKKRYRIPNPQLLDAGFHHSGAPKIWGPKNLGPAFPWPDPPRAMGCCPKRSELARKIGFRAWLLGTTFLGKPLGVPIYPTGGPNLPWWPAGNSERFDPSWPWNSWISADNLKVIWLSTFSGRGEVIGWSSLLQDVAARMADRHVGRVITVAPYFSKFCIKEKSQCLSSFLNR